MQAATHASQITSLPYALKAVLPDRARRALEAFKNEPIEEIRFHADRYTVLKTRNAVYRTSLLLEERELAELLNRMCGGSLYAYAESINRGFLSLGEDLRVGVCGRAATEGNRVIGVSRVNGLVVRLPNRVCPSLQQIFERLLQNGVLQSTLVYAPPGVGKTTFLRALAREAAGKQALHTVVVDCREELAASLTGAGLDLDCLCGYPKALGVEIAVRSLGAQLIVCDEIGSAEDADAVLQASNCGVPVVCSAHASKLDELLRRPFLASLHRARAFGVYLGLSRTQDQFFYQINERRALDGDSPGGNDRERL